MAFLTPHQLAFIFGLLGNIVSFMVFLSPLPTFYTIYKKKSSSGFQSIPYVIALLSAMLLLYYAFLKTDAVLIITINAIGCVIELFYLVVYLIYAPKKEKIFTLGLVAFIALVYGSMIVTTIFVLDGKKRVDAVGWICAAFNVAVFAAPLSIMKQVITSKSVEYMPFSLSLFLTLCATIWFFYGLFVRDLYIAVPNVLGLVLGISQIILYIIYRGSKGSTTSTLDQTFGDPIKLESRKVDFDQRPRTGEMIMIEESPWSSAIESKTRTDMKIFDCEEMMKCSANNV